MARRKTKRKRRTQRAGQKPLPGFVWMLFGLALGLAVAAAIYVNERELSGATEQAGTEAPTVNIDELPADSLPARREPRRFAFYDILPKFEVIIPEEDLEARADSRPEPVEAPGNYVLQAGSFSTFSDADRMKARLALLGIVSRIQKVSVDDATYHRVRIGPVKQLDELNALRDQLREARIEVMVIRVAG